MPSFPCYIVEKDEEGRVAAGFARRDIAGLPPGDVLIRVKFSSLNFKDGLAARGDPTVARSLPHVPGIDAAGIVEESAVPGFVRGQEVIVTGHELGSGRWGGWSEFIRVPADWVVPMPSGLHPEESMAIGTAGFTAALSVRRLVEQGVEPGSGEVVVTGATGGVGSVAVMILARLGYRVAAVTGKAERAAWLSSLGAASVIGREEVDIEGGKALLKSRWAGAVDTVGGNTLATLLRSTAIGGCVTACGLVGGAGLPTTVHPFILRGITLCGIDSAWTPGPRRLETWAMLAGPWKPIHLASISRTIDWKELPAAVDDILAGRMVGRTVLRIAG